MKRWSDFFLKKLKSIHSFFNFKPIEFDERTREIAHKDANQLIADAKIFIATGEVSKNLEKRLDLLLAQDTSLKTYDALEILLDYAERNLRR
ncbi:MAG: hypothetical protein PHY93_17810 [Bacteriovorax sp.]|nr:hypothetical protein [Bacteriovorax sp.]